jgi:multidrug efflux pump subunit AcrA (membrane-fusion protein)
VATAQTRELPTSTTLVATVQPITRSLIATEVAGIVRDMPVRQGDYVEIDSIICKLDDDAVALQLREAQARLANLRAQLAELEAGTRQTELGRLKAMYESSKAEFDRWKFERERVRRLYGESQSNEKEMYETQASYLAAEAKMEAAKAQYDQGVEGPRAETIEQARFAVAEQEAVVARLQRDLAKTEIRAPFSGYVVRLESEVGEWIDRGAPVVELVDLASVLVTVDAPERAIPFVKVGDPAVISIDALQDRFEGEIKHVVPQADEAARTFPVEVEVPNGEHVLKAGMFARATIRTGPDAAAVAVPKDAISRMMGATYVATIAPGPAGFMAYPTPVTVGLDIDDWIAITSGNIAPGAQVVVRGNEMITLMMAPAAVEIIEVDGKAPPAPPPGGPKPGGPTPPGQTG